MDLRGGAAFIIAGLVSRGETHLAGVEHIDRGYERIEERFKSLGVDIKRIQSRKYISREIYVAFGKAC